jgi:hypothetical protein
MASKTPGNAAELEKLKELFRQSQIDQSLLFEKVIKAAQYGSAKSVVMEATNQDLVEAVDEARKKRNKVSGKNGKARVLDKDAYAEQLQWEFNLWWTASIYGKPIVKPQNSSIIYNLGFSKIGDDILSWEITSERKKKARIQPKTPLNRAAIRTLARPKKQAIRPQTPQKRRKHKVVIRRAQETQVTEVITHVTRGGRPVRQKKVEYK